LIISPIAQQRCFVHDYREAVARCPACHNTFCRECVTEHEGRVVCAACLKNALGTRSESRHRLRRLLTACLPIAALLIAWWVFYGIGRILIMIPAPVHDGSAWSE
jgi:hypothetical protein